MTIPRSRALLRSAVTVSALALLASPAVAQRQRPAASGGAAAELNAAAALQKAGKAAEALQKYDAVIKSSPKMFEAFANRGSLYLQLVNKVREMLNDKNELKQSYLGVNNTAEAAKIDPEIAELKKKEGEYMTAALADYDQAIKLNPGRAELYYDRGTALAEAREFDKALTDFDEFIKRSPKEIKGYNGRGLVYFDRAKAVRDKLKDEKRMDAGIQASKADFEKAIADFTKCLELDPKMAAAYHNRAACNALVLEYDQAVADYTKAIELEPSNRRAFKGRSEIYKALEANFKATGERPKEAENKALKEKDLAEVKRLEEEAKKKEDERVKAEQAAADAKAAAAKPGAAPAPGAPAPAASPAPKK